MSERPKTHQERAEIALTLASGAHPRIEAARVDIVARETYPTELVDAALRVLAPHQTPETLDKALADLDAALAPYEDKP